MATAYGVYVTVDDLKARLGITGTSDDTVLGQICDETNQWIESYTGRVLGPVASATYTFDGGGPENPSSGTLDLTRLGIRSVTQVQTATTTGAALSPLDADEYYVRPLNRPNGEPATHIYLDGPSFYSGFGTIEVTMEAGFDQVPDDVRAVAIGIATRAWHGRQNGMTDVVGSDETGEPIVTKIVAPEFKRTLDRYRPVLVR